MHYEPTDFEHLSVSGAAQIKSDTLTLLLCAQLAKQLTLKDRAMKVSRCCQLIAERTNDYLLLMTCRKIIKQFQGGQYIKINAAIQLTESNYFKEYK